MKIKSTPIPHTELTSISTTHTTNESISMPTLKPCHFRAVLLCVLFIPVQVLVIQQQYVSCSYEHQLVFFLTFLYYSKTPKILRKHITPWTNHISIDYCVCNWFRKLSIIWNCPGNWFRRLSVNWNCPDNWFRRLSINWTCPDIWFRRLSINWTCPDNWFRWLSMNWNCPENGFRRLSINWDCPDNGFRRPSIN